jgi:hypothetical protein
VPIRYAKTGDVNVAYQGVGRRRLYAATD